MTVDVDGAGVDPPGEHVGPQGAEVVVTAHGQAGGRMRSDELSVQPAVAVDDVVAAAALDDVAAGTAEDDVAAGERRRTAGQEGGEPADAGDARRGRARGRPWSAASRSSPRRMSFVVPAGERLDEVEAVAVHVDRHGGSSAVRAMSESPATGSPRWVTQSKPSMPSARWMPGPANMMSSPPSAS